MLMWRKRPIPMMLHFLFSPFLFLWPQFLFPTLFLFLIPPDANPVGIPDPYPHAPPPDPVAIPDPDPWVAYISITITSASLVDSAEVTSSSHFSVACWPNVAISSAWCLPSCVDISRSS